MNSSDKQESQPPAPAYPHRPLFPYHHLQLSPHCPQHGHHFLHHNYLHLSPNCPLHRHLLPHCPLHSSISHSNTTTFPNFSSFHLPQNPNANSLLPVAADANSKSNALLMTDRNGEDEEEEEDFTFVLTDEWKDFFAKSQAKRRLAKKQAKKKGKD